MYYVYVHTVPNGKIYIGQAKDVAARWANGEGYVSNREFYKDISIYGWNRIKHEIIAVVRDREAAEKMEAVLIALLRTESKEYGYNQTRIYDDAMKKYSARVPCEAISLEAPLPEEGFFESFNLPVSACKEMVDQWIFNEKHREIIKRRLIDGVSYPDLSKEFSMSVRQLKRIVYSGCAQLEKRL